MTAENTKVINLNIKKDERVSDFSDFQKKDIIEVYNATITERTI